MTPARVVASMAILCVLGCSSNTGSGDQATSTAVGGSGLLASGGGSVATGGATSGTTATSTRDSGSSTEQAGGTGGTLGTGGAASGGSGQTAVDCSGIESAGWEVCDSGPTFCEAVFTEGVGCSEVCATAGLTCVRAYENVEGACAADESRPTVDCDSGHDSDYCVCEGDDGATGSGGTGGTGGTGGSDGSGGTPSIGPKTCGCETPAGEWGTVDETIVVGGGEVYDGSCMIYRANSDTLGDGSQDEGQSPVFRVEDGGTLRNVVLGASAADGIHLYGDVSLENIHWLDIGEDAMTVKESGTVYLDCGSAYDGDDKVFQVNAASEVHISNFTASNAGKFMRQNGGTDFTVDVYVDHCDISNMSEVIFRTDSGSSHATLTNTRYSNLGAGLFMFGSDVVDGNSDQSTVSNNQEY